MSGITVLLLSIAAFVELQPIPQSAFIQERRLFTLDSDLVIVVHDDASREELAPLESINEALGFTPRVAPASRFDVGKRALYIGETTVNPAFGHRSIRRYVPDPSQSPSGAYNLYIRRTGIILAGVDRAGTLHGIQTLTQLINASKRAGLRHRGVAAVPQVEIRDAPDIPTRGIHVRSTLTRAQLQHFAQLKCNLIIFESDDFYDLTPERASLWRGIFDDARHFGIEAIPVFQPLAPTNALLRKRPEAVEGRSRIDRMPLHDDDWTALTKRNILLTNENPLRVTVHGQPTRLRQDYLLSEGGLTPPFHELGAPPWMIRRLLGGAISHNATIEVTYSYAPPGSRALCPNAIETRVLLHDALETLLRELRPPYIHGGFGEVTRLAQDLRCRDADVDHVRAFAQMATLMRGIIADLQPRVGMMIWADALLPPSPQSQDKGHALHSAIQQLPGDIMLIPRLDKYDVRDDAHVKSIMDWMIAQKMPLTLALSGDAPETYRLVKALADQTEHTPGVIVLDADHNPDAARVALNKAWTSESPRLTWPETLNDFFHVSLWNPSFERIKEEQINFIARHILAGVAPETLQDRFDHIRRELPREDADVQRAATLFDLLIQYLKLEHEYATGNSRSTMRDLVQLVRRLGDVDNTLDETRVQRIIDTVEKQQLFVPASILLGAAMPFYRPGALPARAHPYELPARPDYKDTTGRAEVTLDFLAQCGPIFRVDFETVNARAITAQASDDGATYETLETHLPASTDELRGPLLFARPVRSRYLRLRVDSHDEHAALREVRAFALKMPPRVVCPLIASSNAEMMVWPESERAVGMLHEDGVRLAVAPTEIRLAHNRDHLFIGIMAQDPMPHAMGASMTGKDAPLWEEESVEIRLQPPGRLARRFLVNPLGARYDGMAVAANLDQWDAGWDSDWRVEAEKTDTGWSATLMLPFSILGGAPRPGDTWQLNFLRHRNNVEQETSLWAIDRQGGKLPYGILVFE